LPEVIALRDDRSAEPTIRAIDRDLPLRDVFEKSMGRVCRNRSVAFRRVIEATWSAAVRAAEDAARERAAIEMVNDALEAGQRAVGRYALYYHRLQAALGHLRGFRDLYRAEIAQQLRAIGKKSSTRIIDGYTVELSDSEEFVTACCRLPLGACPHVPIAKRPTGATHISISRIKEKT
jgi:hypothetical protein